MRRVVVCVLDGLRRDLVSEANTPELVRLARRAEWGAAHRSVFPSATRVVSAAFATGCQPGRTELQGNSMALIEQGRLVAHDAGHPDFLQHKRRVTGRALGVPTMAERLAGAGGAIVFSNVSPGAAYAHDPDGHGHVYHRAGSYGPGRRAIEGAGALGVSLDGVGDTRMTERFIDEVLLERRPALSLLWMADPDITQHAQPLGSPAVLAAIRQADANAGRVIAAVDRLRGEGGDVLLIVCSDHGHQTVSRVIDVDAELVAAGLKDSVASTDVVVTSNGTSVLVYVAPEAAARLPDLEGFLGSRDWTETVVPAARLAELGQQSRHGLAFAVSLKSDEKRNAFGIPGCSVEARPAPGKSAHQDCGQHGGLGRYEQSPFLLLDGDGFKAGATRASPTGIVDLAPTILAHLGQPLDGMDGHALQGEVA